MTPTSRSTPSAEPRSATSSSSSETSRTRGSCCSSRTTGPTQTILTAANAVISRNRGRKDKRLWSDKGLGAPIVGYVADNEHDEAAFVAGEIDKLSDAGLATYGDTAVFYRTNAMSRVFEEVFIRVGMPYKVVGGVRFYERREVRDALAYLRLLANPEDAVSLRRIINVPKRGIGERAQACVQALAERDRITFWQALRRVEDAPGLAARSLTALLGFRELIDGLRDLVDAETPPSQILEQVLGRTGTSPSCRRRPTPRTRAGWRTCASSSRWQVSSRRLPRRDRSPTSSSGWPSSPTPTRSPRATSTAEWSRS